MGLLDVDRRLALLRHDAAEAPRHPTTLFKLPFQQHLSAALPPRAAGRPAEGGGRATRGRRQRRAPPPARPLAPRG